MEPDWNRADFCLRIPPCVEEWPELNCCAACADGGDVDNVAETVTVDEAAIADVWMIEWSTSDDAVCVCFSEEDKGGAAICFAF